MCLLYIQHCGAAAISSTSEIVRQDDGTAKAPVLIRLDGEDGQNAEKQGLWGQFGRRLACWLVMAHTRTDVSRQGVRIRGCRDSPVAARHDQDHTVQAQLAVPASRRLWTP
jgi:hypothetical protein